MRVFLFVFLILGMASANVEDYLKNFLKGLNGFFTAFNKDGNMNNFKECLTQADAAVPLVIEFVEKIQHVEWNNAEKVLDFLIFAFETGKKVCDTLDPCAKVQDDIANLIQAINNLDWKLVGQDALNNVFLLVNWANAAIKDFKEGDYFGFGENIGKFAHFIIFRKRTP